MPWPLPDAFSDLSTTENINVQLIKHASSSLSSFFTPRLSQPPRSQVCLRCLEECNMLVSPHDLESILMSCDQNIRAAHSTIINDVIRKMHADLSQWAETRTAECRHTEQTHRRRCQRINRPRRRRPHPSMDQYRSIPMLTSSTNASGRHQQDHTG